MLWLDSIVRCMWPMPVVPSLACIPEQLATGMLGLAAPGRLQHQSGTTQPTCAGCSTVQPPASRHGEACHTSVGFLAAKCVAAAWLSRAGNHGSQSSADPRQAGPPFTVRSPPPPAGSMVYGSCLLQLWPLCRTQTGAQAYCQAQGGFLFPIMNASDLAAASAFLAMQSSTFRGNSYCPPLPSIASVSCGAWCALATPPDMRWL
jgi:hypothetical protein